MKIIIPKEDDIFHCQVCDTKFSFNFIEDTDWDYEATNTNPISYVKRNYVICPTCGIKHMLSEWVEWEGDL